MTLRMLLFLTALMLASGCAPHRPAEITPPALPQSYRGEPVTANPATDRWWDSLEDPALNALIEQALKANLDLQQTAARLEQVQATLRGTRSAQWPALTLEAQAGRDSQPSFLGDSTGNNYRLSLAAAYEVDLWKKLSSRSKAALLDATASRLDLAALTMNISAQVADLYYLGLEQRQQLELTDSTIASFAETEALVDQRYREGLVPALDLYQARQNLSAARSRRPQYEAGLATAESALALLLGQTPRPGLLGVGQLPVTPVTFPAGLPSQLLARRPDIQAALLRLQASDARVAAAIADRFPSFNLTASLGETGSSFATGDISGSFWSLLVKASQPLFDAGRRKAEVDRTQAVFDENLARYHKTVLVAFQEVEDALVRNRTGEDRIRYLQERVVASDAALRLSTDRYLQGLSDYLPVLTAQGLYFDARKQLLESRRQLLSDRISLARALGGDWMAQEIEHRLSDNSSKGFHDVP